MEKDFTYISDMNLVFLILLGTGFIPILMTVVSMSEESRGLAVGAGVTWLLWLVILGMCYITSSLKGHFTADDKECDFTFFRGNLHLRYEDINSVSFFNIPKHSRYGSLIAYEIQLIITDKRCHQHVIRQRVSMEYSSFDYPQSLPEEVQNAELTQIGNFLKSKLNHEEIPDTPEAPEISDSVMYPNIADSPEMKEIQERMAERKYIKNIEIPQVYDFIENCYKMNLILTLTNDDTFYDEDDLKIQFENISDLETNLKGIMPPSFTILDYGTDGYSPENRYELIENEWKILSFYFEKAEITS